MKTSAVINGVSVALEGSPSEIREFMSQYVSNESGNVELEVPKRYESQSKGSILISQMGTAHIRNAMLKIIRENLSNKEMYFTLSGCIPSDSYAYKTFENLREELLNREDEGV